MQSEHDYSRVPGHRNWQIETAVWNLAGFLYCALETRWQRIGFGQFVNDFLYENLKFLQENLNFLCENLRVYPWKIPMIFPMIFLTIHKIFYKVRVSTGGVETRWGCSFLMVCRNNSGRLGAGFISVCLKTCRLGHKRGFYVPELFCNSKLDSDNSNSAKTHQVQ